MRIETVTGRVVCEEAILADGPLARMKGLLGRSTLPPGQGVLLRPASSVHTGFMRFPIDAVFLDRDLRVLRVAADLSPWRAAACRGAHAVLEIPAGESERRRVRPGDAVVLVGEA
jgi:uncharacterized membrane protein (UPF0127 family)